MAREINSIDSFRFKLFLVMALVLVCHHAAFASDKIVIGASLPLSGPLAGFGGYQRWGYEAAVADINEKGGVSIKGEKRLVQLVIRDDKTDPVTTSRNVQTLINRDNAVALLGSCTPALVNAGGLMAERSQIPMVTGCSPLASFRSVRQWRYVWSIFFDEPDVAQAPFKMLQELAIPTNRKIAILHDNGPDGTAVGGEYWPKAAAEAGYEIVVKESFPIDNTQFGSMLLKAKDSGADIVLVNAITPQAVAIRKQMETAGLRPKVLFMEKGAEPEQFATALGKLADGVMVGSYWDPSFPFPGSKALGDRFERESGSSFSQHIADSYAATQVLLDAIEAAGSVDREAINTAIAATDKSYVVGPVKFTADHTSKIPTAIVQWQAGKPIVVWPKERTTGVIFAVAQ